MPIFSVQELKKSLIAAGLEVYRVRPDAVLIAERPRENQILDSGIAIGPRESDFELRVVVRAQRSDFPKDDADDLFARVRAHARTDLAKKGYREHLAREHSIMDPGDPSRLIDVWFEVEYRQTIKDLTTAIGEVRRVLTLEKYAKPPEETAHD
jgi:hypothetical protein